MKKMLLLFSLLIIVRFAFTQTEVAPERTWTLEASKNPQKGVLTYTATGFIATNEGNGIRLVNPQSGLNKKIIGSLSPVRLVVNSPDNKYLLSASDANISLWDLRTLTETQVKSDGLDKWLLASDVAGQVEGISNNNTVRIAAKVVKKATEKISKTVGNERKFASIQAINIAFNSQCLIGNNIKGVLQMLAWNASTGRVDTIASLPKTDDPDDRLFISPDNQLLAYNYSDTEVTRIWLNGIEHNNLPYTKKTFGFSPDNSELATAVQDGIAIWNPMTGVNKTFLETEPNQVVTAFSFHRLARFYAATLTDQITNEHFIAIWDVASGRRLRTFSIPNAVIEDNICFNYDGNYLACRMVDDQLFTWDMRKLLDEVPSYTQNLLPKIIWTTPKTKTEIAGTSIDLKACIESPTALKDVKIFINGKTQAERGVQLVKSGESSCANAFQKTLQLQAGENAIYLQVTNSAGNIASETRYVYAGGVKSKPLTKKLALVIGNATYVKAGKLDNPLNDAKNMAVLLKELGFEVIQATDLNRQKMIETVRNFTTKLRGYDVGLVFYAGHGVQVGGKNYLIPTDADLKSETDVEFKCFSLQQLLENMEGTAKNNIVLLDACRDNPFETTWNRESSGLAKINVPDNFLIAYATDAGKTAADGEAGKNGVYTTALLTHLRSKGSSIFEALTRVRNSVDENTEGGQKPSFWSHLSETVFL
jgi:aspartate 1-decarboxylase